MIVKKIDIKKRKQNNLPLDVIVTKVCQDERLNYLR